MRWIRIALRKIWAMVSEDNVDLIKYSLAPAFIHSPPIASFPELIKITKGTLTAEEFIL